MIRGVSTMEDLERRVPCMWICCSCRCYCCWIDVEGDGIGTHVVVTAAAAVVLAVDLVHGGFRRIVVVIN